MYSPMVAIEVAAEKATVEPREGRARTKERVALSQMERIGERKRSSTLWKKAGMPWSYCVEVSGLCPKPRGDILQCILWQRSKSCASWKSSRRAHNVTRRLESTKSLASSVTRVEVLKKTDDVLMIENTASAPFSPKTSTRIFNTGRSYSLSSAAAKSCIKNKKPIRQRTQRGS